MSSPFFRFDKYTLSASSRNCRSQASAVRRPQVGLATQKASTPLLWVEVPGRRIRGVPCPLPFPPRSWERRMTCHSSVCSTTRTPTKRMIDASLGKMPTTSARRLISLITRSKGLVDANCAQCSCGQAMKASTSSSASSMSSESFLNLPLCVSAICRHCLCAS